MRPRIKPRVKNNRTVPFPSALPIPALILSPGGMLEAPYLIWDLRQGRQRHPRKWQPRVCRVCATSVSPSQSYRSSGHSCLLG